MITESMRPKFITHCFSQDIMIILINRTVALAKIILILHHPDPQDLLNALLRPISAPPHLVRQCSISIESSPEHPEPENERLLIKNSHQNWSLQLKQIKFKNKR